MKVWILGGILALGLTGFSGSTQEDFKVEYQPFGINLLAPNYDWIQKDLRDITDLVMPYREKLLEYIDSAPSSICLVEGEYGRLKIQRGETEIEIDGRGCILSGDQRKQFSPADFREFRSLLDKAVPGSERYSHLNVKREWNLSNEPISYTVGEEAQAIMLAWAKFSETHKGKKFEIADVVFTTERIRGRQWYGGYAAFPIPDGAPVIVIHISPKLYPTDEMLSRLHGPTYRATFIFRESNLEVLHAIDEIPY